MMTQKRPKRKIRRPDNDPDLCRLQALWVRSKGSEAGFEPVLRQFQNDPHARLEEYVRRYQLH